MNSLCPSVCVDNQFADRVLLLCTQKKLRRCKHDFYTVCSLEDIQSFTFIQIVLCAGIFGITLTPAAMVFPMLIGILIPFRLITLPKYYDIESLHTLDPFIEEDSHIEEELAKRVIEDNDDEDLAEEREEVDMLIRARSRSNSSVLSDVMNIGVANDGVVNIEMKASHV